MGNLLSYVSLLIVFLLFGHKNVIAQCLVRNNSFELVDTTGPGIDYIANWRVYHSVDFFSENLSIAGWASPCNVFGCQYSRTGISHIGLYHNANTTSNYREYIQTKLIQPLIPGRQYCVSFYISRSDTMEYASKDWGILFTDNIVVTPVPPAEPLINAMAQVTVPYFVTDDENWTLIQQIYIPSSPNEYITIGNFLEDAIFPQQFVQSSCSGCKQSYYYIDDVSVSLIRDPILPNDTTIDNGESILIGDIANDEAIYNWSPTTGLSNSNSWQTFASPDTTTIYTLTKITSCDTTEASIRIEVLASENNLAILPNPNNGEFQIRYNLMEDADFVVYDALGRMIQKNRLSAGVNVLYSPEMLNLASAVYLITLENGRERLFQTKMVVSK